MAETTDPHEPPEDDTDRVPPSPSRSADADSSRDMPLRRFSAASDEHLDRNFYKSSLEQDTTLYRETVRDAPLASRPAERSLSSRSLLVPVLLLLLAAVGVAILVLI